MKSDVGHWGAIKQAILMCEEAEAGWKGINQGYGMILGLLGECYFELNKLGQAEKFLLRGRKIGLDLMDTGLLLPTSLTLVHLKQALGEQQAAQILLEETGKLLIKHTQIPLSVVHACQARLDMKALNLTLTKKWLNNQPVATDEDLDKRHMYEYLTILRAYICLNQTGQGIRFGEKLLQFCSALYLHYYIVEINLLLAVLYERNGDTRTSLRKIEHALIQGQEEGYVQLFLDAWDLAKSIIRKYAKHAPISKEIHSFVEQLIQYDNDRKLYTDKTSFAEKKLSSKEYKVLQYLIEGKSNAFIAESMSITIETVKTHCKHIYKKLHLKSRKDVQKTFL